MAVESILDKQGLAFSKVVPGEIHLPIKTNPKNLDELGESLSRIGLELIDDRISGIIEKIKQMVIRNARNEVEEKEKKMKLSTWLSQHLHLEYTYLSSLFSSIEGRTIENYFIEQRIERVKEFLVYDEMTLSEIAFELDYSSVAHLSNQFKKITGLSPSHFKKIGAGKRKLLDEV
jgi:AraC-like DNA-binding protein